MIEKFLTTYKENGKEYGVLPGGKIVCITDYNDNVEKSTKEKEYILSNYKKDFKIENGNLILKKFSIVVPNSIVEKLYKNLLEKKHSKKGLLEFYKMLLINPDTEVYNDIFEWFEDNEFVITKKGFIIGYKDVVKKNSKKDELEEFVLNSIKKLKYDGKKLKNTYVIEKDNEYVLKTKKELDKWFIKNGMLAVEGTLLDLIKELKQEDIKEEYTDKHTRTMRIKLFNPVEMDRNDCDNNPYNTCSRGLHIKSPSYGIFADTSLVCLIAPFDIVAVPKGERYKFRTCYYLPVGYADTNENGNIIPLKEGEYDFSVFEEHLENRKLQILRQYKTVFEDRGYDFNKIKKEISKRIINKNG